MHTMNPKRRNATTYRGSRKHVLDWVESPDFLNELSKLLAPISVRLLPTQLLCHEAIRRRPKPDSTNEAPSLESSTQCEKRCGVGG